MRSQQPDVIVVGAGIIGSSIAWRLGQRGIAVQLRDAGRMGCQASSAGAGMLAPGGEVDGPSTFGDLLVESLRLYPDFVRELSDATGVQIDYQQCGAIESAGTEEEWIILQARARAQAGMGVRSEPVGGNALFYPDDAIVDQPMTAEFGTQCLMARRLVESGVRFVQLYSGGKKGSEVGWDGHNECDQNHQFMAAKVDKPIAGLLADLKSRGLFDSTVVLWGGDFGRTPFTDGAESGGGNRNGRDHNPYGFSVWLAGGGSKGGRVIGATDEIGLHAQEDKVTMHDLHASILHLLGMDHKRLTYFYQGRDFRLTDVHGENNLGPRLLS